MTTIPLSQIRRDGGTQTRALLNYQTTQEYIGAMLEGAIFPPIVVFYDGTDYWLADGFHRVEAARQAGITELAATVATGTQRDAVLHAAGANSTHGLQRTIADKRRAVELLLRDSEWGQWSDREIAKRCHVSHTFVASMRPHSGNVATERLYTHPKSGETAVFKPHSKQIEEEFVNLVKDETAVSNDDLPATVWLLQSTMAGWFIPDWSAQDRLNFVNTALRGPGPARDDLKTRIKHLNYREEDVTQALKNLQEIYEGQLVARQRGEQQIQRPSQNEWLDEQLAADDDAMMQEIILRGEPQEDGEIDNEFQEQLVRQHFSIHEKRPAAPMTWRLYTGRACPVCETVNATWQPAVYDVPDEEWSKFRWGKCNNCGCQFWADYGVPARYYYNPMSGVLPEPKLPDPRLARLREAEIIVTGLLTSADITRESEFILSLNKANSELYKAIDFLRRP